MDKRRYKLLKRVLTELETPAPTDGSDPPEVAHLEYRIGQLEARVGQLEELLGGTPPGDEIPFEAPPQANGADHEGPPQLRPPKPRYGVQGQRMPLDRQVWFVKRGGGKPPRPGSLRSSLYEAVRATDGTINAIADYIIAKGYYPERDRQDVREKCSKYLAAMRQRLNCVNYRIVD